MSMCESYCDLILIAEFQKEMSYSQVKTKTDVKFCDLL